MSRLKPLTHEEHLVLAANFKKTLQDLINIRNQVWQSCGVSSRAAKIVESVIKKLDISFRGEMDTHYHKVTDSEQFLKHGHAYYDERKE